MTFRDTVDPTVFNDGTQGFEIGGTWLNTTTEKLSVCDDNATNAADWRAVGGDPPRLIQSSQVMVVNDTLLRVNSSSGKITFELVPAATFKDRILRVIHTVPISDLTVAPSGSETIQGEGTIQLAGDGVIRSLTLDCDGAAWFIA